MAIKIQNKNQINLTLNDDLLKDTKKHSKDLGYNNIQELIRESIREKIYAKTREQKIQNKFLEQIEKEKEYLFRENKDIYERLKLIAKQI